MNNLKLTENDYKSFETYLKTRNENILLNFYERFGNQICSVIYAKMVRKMYSIPLEKNDLAHIVWKNIKYVVEKINQIPYKNKFMNILLNACYQTAIREARKYFTNGERIMNNIVSYDEQIESNKYFDAKTNNIVYMQKSYDDSYNDITNFILERLKKLDKRDVKKVIYLKSIGYSNVEIEKKLNFSQAYVRKIITTIKKIGESY